MAKSIDEQIAEIDEAITDILTGDGATPAGQSIEIRGRTIERPDLETLRFWRSRLSTLKNRADRGGARVRRGVPLDD